MATDVYFKRIDSGTDIKTIQEISKQLLDTIIEKEKIVLEKKIPLKVHFGEQKNVTFLKRIIIWVLLNT